ncbi:MAG: ribonuclease HI family protein [Bacteroidota bacterium]
MTIHAFTDGAARGNPGEGGVGILFKDEHGKTVATIYGYIGEATNNVAEYQALLACLKAAPKTKCTRLVVHSDSELLVRQITGEYRVKDQTLRRYFVKIHRLLAKAQFEFEIRHVSREQNKEADRLANLGIDTRKRIRA